MKNLLFKISYDGTNYCGFQSQKTVVSVQETIENALSKLTGEKTTVYGCGRTDAGVHAINYYFNFRTNSTIPPERFHLALTAHLPEDIVPLTCREVPADFHARVCAVEKTYIYKILNRSAPDALNRKRCYHYPHHKLDIDKMKNAAKHIIGKKDFKMFMSSGSSVKTTVRTVSELEISKAEDVITIKITADGFLYNMVRIIVGTLIGIGNGKMSEAELLEVIEKKSRVYAGATVPPQGLYLFDVNYGEISD